MISMMIATLQDAAEMAPHMRPPDVLEVEAAGGYSPLGALEDSILMSRGSAWAIRYDGKILGIWGVVDLSTLTGVGIPWLLTTGLVDEHPKPFYKGSLLVVGLLKKKYGLLTNYIDARHVKALRWAKRIGFNVAAAPQPFGAGQLSFYRIDLIGDNHV